MNIDAVIDNIIEVEAIFQVHEALEAITTGPSVLDMVYGLHQEAEFFSEYEALRSKSASQAQMLFDVSSLDRMKDFTREFAENLVAEFPERLTEEWLSKPDNGYDPLTGLQENIDTLVELVKEAYS